MSKDRHSQSNNSSNPSRRSFLKQGATLGAALGIAGTGTAMASCSTSSTDQIPGDGTSLVPKGLGTPGQRTLIKGGMVLSIDDSVGNFVSGDILIEGKKIVEIGANISATEATVINAKGKIVMPGFVDTHHHQFETALRSFLSNGILGNDGRPENKFNYEETILKGFSRVYRPEDVHISELYGNLSQLDAGVTTALDVSQIHHSPEHTDAAIQGLTDSGRRCALGYFEGWGEKSKYPSDAARIKEQYFSSEDQLTTMVMGAEIYYPNFKDTWKIGRELGLPVAFHVVGSLGIEPIFSQLAGEGMLGDDNILIHMTAMSNQSWKYAADAGAHVSIAVPIEMQMRHGIPPIQQAIDYNISSSLSTDVEVTMTADFFTQMRGLITLQRMFANEKAISGVKHPDLMKCIDAIGIATMGGAKGLKLDHKIGSLSPGKEADIIMLDAEAINVMPVNNVPGAVVTLMERSNVDTVMVAGQVKKWNGKLVDADISKLSRQLEASRDYLFEAAGIKKDLFA